MMQKYNIKKASLDQFDNWAKHYDIGLWSLYFRYSYKKVIEIAKPYIGPGNKILDIGCGTGELTIRLSSLLDENGEIIGTDISSEMIKIANYKKNKYCKNKNLKFIVGEANKLPFPNNYFHFVFCLNSFHHYPNQRQALEEIYRVLKPNG
ncbi:methyltransferase domain-containing protein, partial [bacterium]|nr:methyltransferase domain-containing protein [bacterium]